VEFGISKLFTRHVAADRRATQTLLFHRSLELLHSQIRILQRQRCEGGEAVGFRAGQLGPFLVLGLDDLSGQVAVLVIPERVDR